MGSKFMFTDLTSLISPDQLFSGDINSFLNILVLFTLFGSGYCLKKYPEHRSNIFAIATGIIISIIILFLSLPEQKEDSNIISSEEIKLIHDFGY